MKKSKDIAVIMLCKNLINGILIIGMLITTSIITIFLKCKYEKIRLNYAA